MNDSRMTLADYYVQPTTVILSCMGEAQPEESRGGYEGMDSSALSAAAFNGLRMTGVEGISWSLHPLTIGDRVLE